MKAVIATSILVLVTFALFFPLHTIVDSFKISEFEYKTLKFEVLARNVSNLQRVTIINFGDDLKLKDVVVTISTDKDKVVLKNLPVRAVGIPKTHGVGGVFSKKCDTWKFGQSGYVNLAKRSFGVLKRGDKIKVEICYKNLKWESPVTFNDS